MKKLLVLLVLFVLGSVGVVSAESSVYAKAVSIAKITSHEKGYKVTYYTDFGDLKTVYIPIEWFYKTSGFLTTDGFTKAELVRGKGPVYPYMEIFWKDGQFHHVRLYVVADYSDRSWGIVQDASAMAAKFDPNKPLDLQF